MKTKDNYVDNDKIIVTYISSLYIYLDEIT